MHMSADFVRPEFQPQEYRGYLRMLAEVKPLRVAAGKVDASDLVQECLLKAYTHRAQFHGSEECEYRAWLRTILANVVVETARRFSTGTREATLERSIHATIDESGRRLDELLVTGLESPAKLAIHHETINLALSALDNLPQDQHDAIRLHHMEQMSVDEVAAKMERSPASVAGLLRRGLNTLRTSLDSADSHE